MANQKTAPLSPHLQIWGWTIMMATSIGHRATGIALYSGTVFLTIWLAAAAAGENIYNKVQAVYGSPFGLIILAGFSWAICFHLLNGLRFLFWDAGHGFEVKVAKRTAWGVVFGSFVLTLIIWGAALSKIGGAL